jgi:hypothetical protein
VKSDGYEHLWDHTQATCWTDTCTASTNKNARTTVPTEQSARELYTKSPLWWTSKIKSTTHKDNRSVLAEPGGTAKKLFTIRDILWVSRSIVKNIHVKWIQNVCEPNTRYGFS